MNRCPVCKSVLPMQRLAISSDKSDLCRNSWHPTQAFPVPKDAKHMTATCGSHCGVKDGMSGHCDCKACHNGRRKAEGLKKLQSTIGLSVTGVDPT